MTHNFMNHIQKNALTLALMHVCDLTACVASTIKTTIRKHEYTVLAKPFLQAYCLQIIST